MWWESVVALTNAIRSGETSRADGAVALMEIMRRTNDLDFTPPRSKIGDPSMRYVTVEPKDTLSIIHWLAIQPRRSDVKDLHTDSMKLIMKRVLSGKTLRV
jgi:hypothetical protein